MMVDRCCANPACAKAFKARAADVARGWGVYCCKRCKAVVQEGRTGQYAAMLARPAPTHSRLPAGLQPWEYDDEQFQIDMDAAAPFGSEESFNN